MNDKFNYLISLITLHLFLNNGFAQEYPSFNLSAHGSAEIIALAEATIAFQPALLSDNSNPAALLRTNKVGVISAGLHFENIDPTDFGSSVSSKTLNLYESEFSGFLIIKNFGIGLLISSPFISDQLLIVQPGGFKDTRKLTLDLKSIQIPVAYKLNSNLSISLTLNLLNLSERYQFSSDNPVKSSIDENRSKSSQRYNFHLYYNNPENTWRVGLGVKSRSFFDIDENANSQLDSSNPNWFRNSKIPFEFHAGFELDVSKKIKILSEIEIADIDGSLEMPGSQVISGFNQVSVTSGLAITPKLSAIIINKKKAGSEFLLLTGIYHANKLQNYLGKELHITGGTRLRFNRVISQFGFDFSKSNFISRIQLGLNF